MKMRPFIISFLAVGATLFLVWAVAAQEAKGQAGVQSALFIDAVNHTESESRSKDLNAVILDYTADITFTPAFTVYLPAIFKNRGLGRFIFTSERDGLPEIYVMNVDGTGQTRLTSLGAINVSARLSPDGRRIAVGAYYGDDTLQAYVMNVDGSNPTHIASVPHGGNYPFWSPDGRILYTVYASNASGSRFTRFYSMNVDGTAQTHLFDLDIEFGSPLLSPDGQRIVGQTIIDDAGHTDIYVVSIDGTGLTRLTYRETYSYHPAWSPDGQQIAFASGVIWIVNTDGTGFTPLPTYGNGSCWAPDWSPDGEWIAFGCGTSHDSEDIFVIRPDGTGLTQLIDSPGSDNTPSWGP